MLKINPSLECGCTLGWTASANNTTIGLGAKVHIHSFDWLIDWFFNMGIDFYLIWFIYLYKLIFCKLLDCSIEWIYWNLDWKILRIIIEWLTDRLIDWMIHYIIYRLINDWLFDWLIDVFSISWIPKPVLELNLIIPGKLQGDP